MDRALSTQNDNPDLNEARRAGERGAGNRGENRQRKRAEMPEIQTGIRGLSPYARDPDDPINAVLRHVHRPDPSDNKDSYKMLSLEKRFRGHFTSITAVVCDKNGEFVITSSKDGLIKMWDMSPESLNGVCTLRYTFRGHADAVTDICISYDNRFLFSCGDDKRCIVWCLETGRLLYIYEFFHNKLYPHDAKLHEHAIFVSFSSVYAGPNKSSFCYCYFVGHLGSVMAIRCDIDPRTKRLMLDHPDDCSCGDFSYNCTKRFVHYEIPAISPSNVNSVDVSASGDVIALACKDNIIRMFKVDRFSDYAIVRLPHLYGHVSAVSSVEFSSGLFSSLPCVISCSNDGTIRVWLNHVDSVNYTEVVTYNLRKQVEATLISNSSTDIVRLRHHVEFENQKAREIFQYRCNQLENPALRNSIHKKIIANYNNNNTNNVLINSEFGLAFDNVNNNDSKKRMPAKLQTKKLGVTVTAFSDSLNKLCAACNDNSIVVLNFNLTASDSTKEVLRDNAKSILTIDAILYGHTDSITSLDFHPTDEHLFVSTGIDARFVFWRIPEYSKLTKKNLTNYSCINVVDMKLFPFRFILSCCNKKGTILYDFAERDREQHQKQTFVDSENPSVGPANTNNNTNNNNNNQQGEAEGGKRGKGGVASILFVEGGSRVISVDVEGNICVFSDYLNNDPAFVHSNLREYAEEQFMDSDVKGLLRNDYGELVCGGTKMPPHLTRVPTFMNHESMIIAYEDQLTLYNDDRLCERLFNGEDYEIYDAKENGYFETAFMKRLDSIMHHEEKIRMTKKNRSTHTSIYLEQKNMLLTTPDWFTRPMVKGLKKRELLAAYENFLNLDALYYKFENTSPFTKEQQNKLIGLVVENISGGSNVHNVTATSWYIKSTLYHVIKYSQNDVDLYKKDQAVLQENIKSNVKSQQKIEATKTNDEHSEASSAGFDPNFHIDNDEALEQMSGEEIYYEYDAVTSCSDEEDSFEESTEATAESVIDFEGTSDEVLVVNRSRRRRSSSNRRGSVRRSSRRKRPVDRNVNFNNRESRCKNSKKAALRNYKTENAERVERVESIGQYVDVNTKQFMVYPDVLVDSDKFFFVQVNDRITLLASGLREYYMKLYESKAFIPMMSEQIFNWAFGLNTELISDLLRMFVNFSCDFVVTKVEYIIVPPMCVKVHIKPVNGLEVFSSTEDMYISLYMFDDSYQYFDTSNKNKNKKTNVSFDFLVDTQLYNNIQSSVHLNEKFVVRFEKTRDCEVIEIDRDANNCVSYKGVTVLSRADHYKKISPWSLGIVKNYQNSFTPVDINQSEFLQNLLNSVIGKEYASIFAEPVNIVEYYDYKYFVEQPMDLTKVLNRLINNYYRCEEAFKNDLQMIESNAKKYNFPDSIIVRLAKALIKNMLAAIETRSEMKPIPKQLLLNNSSFDQAGDRNEVLVDEEFVYIPSLLRKRLKIDRETNNELQLKKRKAYFMDDEEDDETRNEAEDADLIKWYLLCARVYAGVKERLVDLVEFFEENGYESAVDYYKRVLKNFERVARRLLQCEYTVYEEFFQEFRYAIVSEVCGDEHVERLTNRLIIDFLNEEQAFIDEKLADGLRRSHRITRNLEASVKKQLHSLIQDNDENYVSKKNRRQEEQPAQKTRPKREASVVSSTTTAPTASNNYAEVGKSPGRKRRALLSDSSEVCVEESEEEVSEDEGCAIRKSARIARRESDVRSSTRSRRKNYNLRVSRRL